MAGKDGIKGEATVGGRKVRRHGPRWSPLLVLPAKCTRQARGAITVTAVGQPWGLMSWDI